MFQDTQVQMEEEEEVCRPKNLAMRLLLVRGASQYYPIEKNEVECFTLSTLRPVTFW